MEMNIEKEELVYANILNKGVKIGFIITVITFIIYISGILPPHIPLNDLPKYSKMSTEEYLTAANIPAGWRWLSMIHKSDFINFIGVVFFSGFIIICYAVIIPIFFKKKDRIYGFLAILQFFILLLAAAGIW